MQKVKIFMSAENRIGSLEDDINAWLDQTDCRVLSITGNIAPQSASKRPHYSPAPSDVMLVVLYESNGAPTN